MNEKLVNVLWELMEHIDTGTEPASIGIIDPDTERDRWAQVTPEFQETLEKALKVLDEVERGYEDNE